MQCLKCLLTPQVSPVPPGGGGIAYYVEAAKDGSREGEYFINLHQLDAFKKFELMALSLHEVRNGKSVIFFNLIK